LSVLLDGMGTGGVPLGVEKDEESIFELIHALMRSHEEMIPPHLLERALPESGQLIGHKTVHLGGDPVVARAVVSDGIIQALVVLHLDAHKPCPSRRGLVADIHVEGRAIPCVAIITATRGVFEVNGHYTSDPASSHVTQGLCGEVEVEGEFTEKVEAERLAGQQVVVNAGTAVELSLGADGVFDFIAHDFPNGGRQVVGKRVLRLRHGQSSTAELASILPRGQPLLVTPKRLQESSTPLEIEFVGVAFPSVVATKKYFRSSVHWFVSYTLNRS
jgi:hypothetical protein